MPLYKEFKDSENLFFIWKHSDKEDFSEIEKNLSTDEYEKITTLPEKKRLEFLMVRKILKTFFPDYKIIYKNNEPTLEPNNLCISITHSYPFVAVAFSKSKIGIDIEKVKDKILKVKDKFIQPEEQIFVPKEKEMLYLSIIWSIKESLYKIHYSNLWSLKKHYEVRKFNLEDNSISCRVHNEDFSDEYSAKYIQIEDFIFTVVKSHDSKLPLLSVAL